MAEAEKLEDLAVAALEQLVSANDGKIEIVEAEMARRIEAGGDDAPAAQQALERIRAAQALKDAAGAQGAGGGATEARSPGEQTYMVQRRMGVGADWPDWALEVWADVALVTVPPRTKRKTIVERALEQVPDATPSKTPQPDTAELEPAFFRVLDTDSGEAIPVRWEIPPSPEPELRIGS